MKYCLINNLYPPAGSGGAEQVAKQQADKLAREGHEVIVITLSKWQGWSSWRSQMEVKNNKKIIRFWAPNIFSYHTISKHNFLARFVWHLIDVFNIFSGFILKKILQNKNPDKVITHNLMGVGFLTPRIIQSLDIEHIHYLHDVQLVEPSGRLPWDHKKDSLPQKINSFFMQKLFNSPDKIISPSFFLQNFYQDRKFFPESDWKIKKKNKNYPKAKKITRPTKFLYAGKFERYKGIEVLIQVWKEINSQNKELYIVGEGSLISEIKQWSETREEVKVFGQIEHKNMPEVYKSCDVLIFPSICIENNPQVIEEALTHKLHILAAETGGTVEFNFSNINFFEPGNIDQMKAEIEQIAV